MFTFGVMEEIELGAAVPSTTAAHNHSLPLKVKVKMLLVLVEPSP
jgi:hypothetical protein